MLQVILVTGGWDGYGPVNSTEVEHVYILISKASLYLGRTKLPFLVFKVHGQTSRHIQNPGIARIGFNQLGLNSGIQPF